MKKPISLVFLAAILGLSFAPSDSLAIHQNDEAKLALYVVPPGSRAAERVERKWPCNEGERLAGVHGDLGVEYDVYLLAADTDPYMGLSRVEFGIRFDGKPESGVDILSWKTPRWKIVPMEPGPRCAAGDTSLAGFAPFRRWRHDYSNDVTSGKRFLSIAPTEVRRLANLFPAHGARSLSQILDNGVLSVTAILPFPEGTRGWEIILGHEEGAAFLADVAGILGPNEALETFRCQFGAQAPPGVRDLTDSVAVAFRGYRVIPGTSRLKGSVRVENTSSTTLEGPLYLVLNPKAGMQVDVALSAVACGDTDALARVWRVEGVLSLAPGEAFERSLPIVSSRKLGFRARLWAAAGGSDD